MKHISYSVFPSALLSIILSLTVAFAFTVFFAFPTHKASAATPADLQTKIQEHNSTIQKLEQEISQYQKQIDLTSKDAQTLQSKIKELDLTQKKLATDLKLTESKISSTNLTIEQLEGEILDKENRINNSLNTISKAIKDLNASDSTTLVEAFLTYGSATEFWDDVETIGQFRDAVGKRLGELRGLQEELRGKKDQNVASKNNLVTLKDNLGDQKKVVEGNKQEKNTLLRETKNKESEYKKLLDQKIALKNAFQKELTQFESELKIQIDPSSVPKIGAGVLSWPLDIVKISQYFGNTEFSKANAQLYNGNGHNGVDLATPVGTAIKSAANGVIAGTGNTDLVCPGASYGQWVLVKHDNGLSSLYAHLSLIKAQVGQSVAVGDIVGYSGNTGYSTGPHLHFTVYASQGVQILSRKSAVCAGTYTMPIADLKAYLNPLSYL